MDVVTQGNNVNGGKDKRLLSHSSSMKLILNEILSGKIPIGGHAWLQAALVLIAATFWNLGFGSCVELVRPGQ